MESAISTSPVKVPVVPDTAPLLTKDPVVVTPVANTSPSGLIVIPVPTFTFPLTVVIPVANISPSLLKVIPLPTTIPFLAVINPLNLR